METLVQDVRYGLRMLIKNPGFTLVAVLSLALGIGANTTIFTLINSVLLHPIPVRDPERLVAIFVTDEQTKNTNFATLSISGPNWKDIRDQNDVFEGTAGYMGAPFSLSGGTGEPEQVFGDLVSGNFFTLLGTTPALGRGLLPEEDRVDGAAPVVVRGSTRSAGPTCGCRSPCTRKS